MPADRRAFCREPTRRPSGGASLQSRLWRLSLDKAEREPSPGVNPPPTGMNHNPAVLTGWICVGIGLSAAWYFPVAYLAFVVALILSSAAMFTRQTRGGIFLLTGAVLGAGASAMLCLVLGTGLGGQELPTTGAPGARARASAPPYVPLQATGSPSRRLPPVSVNPAGAVNLRPLPSAAHPFTVRDVELALRAGLTSQEIVAELRDKQLVETIDANRTERLRLLGADPSLIRFLQLLPVYAASLSRNQVTARPLPPVATAPPPAVEVRAPGMSAEDKDRRVEELKRQIDALDEKLRRIRVNPRGSPDWWHYSGRDNGINQQALDDYQKQLDRERNDLRREKWRLEGR